MQLERLCREAGCDSPDDLPEAERRSAERGRLEDALRDCEDQLLVAGGGADSDRFAAEVEQADADALGPAIERLDREIDELEKEREAVNQTIGAERARARPHGRRRPRRRGRRDGPDDPGPAPGGRRPICDPRLAAAVLQRGIERYREKNQGPVLARASALFADLTGGSFAGLQIDDDGDGRPCSRGSGPTAASSASRA